MSNSKFNAQSWLQQTEKAPIFEQNVEQNTALKKSRSFTQLPLTPPPLPLPAMGKNSFIANQFTTQWEGKFHSTKKAQLLDEIFKLINLQVQSELVSLSRINKSFKEVLFDDYLKFCHACTIQTDDIYSPEILWEKFVDKPLYSNEKSAIHIQRFKDLYIFKITQVYLSKSALISYVLKHLQKSDNHQLYLKALNYPSSFLSSVFKKNTSKEIMLPCFNFNIYNWFRPTRNLQISEKKVETLASITPHELRYYIGKRFSEEFSEFSQFSHSLSQPNLGKLLKTIAKNNSKTYQSHDATLVAGEHISSLIGGLLRSDDIEKEKSFYDFDLDYPLLDESYRTFHQITLIHQVLSLQPTDDTEVALQSTASYFKKVKEKTSADLFQQEIFTETKLFPRIILNFTELPAQNPQHLIYSQLIEYWDKLADEGQLILMSEKKIFLPSQKEKIATVLKKYIIDASITLKEVHGRGELTPYIYIFSKRSNPLTFNKQDPLSCISFRASGNLNSVYDLKELNSLFNEYFNNKRKTPLSHFENKLFKLDVFQDAVFNGKLIQSSSKDMSKITHPSFFKNLVSRCFPFDYFFGLTNIKDFNETHGSGPQVDFFSQLKSQQTQKPKHFVVIDRRDGLLNTKLRFHESSSLEAVQYELGTSQCFYYYISPKINGITLSYIETFYETTIGKQILNMAFDSDNRKIKSSIEKLLVPQFFSIKDKSTNSLGDTSSLFEKTLNLEQVNYIENNLNELILNSPQSLFSNYFQSLIDIRSELEKFKGNFLESETLLKKLVKLEVKNIYNSKNENHDLFISLGELEDRSDFAKPLHSLKLNFEESKDMWFLSLESDGKSIVNIYSEKNYLSFIKIILENYKDISIEQIIHALQLPSLCDYNLVVDDFINTQGQVQELARELYDLTEKSLRLYFN